ncbi:MAG: GNAT family N-acetyltransferase [Pyrinomonadaceae bacterium]|nr:GNAT family N-acetyltransferase [Pyrinomonadaceae bacterium]
MRITAAESWYPSAALPRTGIEILTNEERAETLDFLGRRGINAAFFAGIIYDNGLESSLNRGTFYGYRNSFGQLEGVALVGHATLMEAVTEPAVRALALVARGCQSAHMIMCEENRLEKFWGYYAQPGQEMRRASRQLLLELRWPVEISRNVSKLRLATTDDLELLVPVHAELAFEESGIDPRSHDAAGFTERYARRIHQGRTWVLTEEQKLIFKAEVASTTPLTTYLEGIWVNPEERHQGFGQSCMSQLARMLMWRAKSVCLFVNDESEGAQRFYRQAGYHLRTVYDTIFL